MNRYIQAMSVVGVQRCSRYDAGDLKDRIAAALEPLGGLARFVQKGERVLVKPNLVAPGSPASGICTHPLFVRAVCELIAERNPSRIHVGDMPGYNFLGETARCLKESGLGAALAGSGARIVPFEGTHVRISSPDFRVYRSIEMTREILEADAVISLPKLKTHRQTYYTGAVKNLFGCVAYGTREKIHKLGNYRKFCEGLVDVYSAVRPRLAIGDLVRVQEGNGPSAGVPVDVGVILASADGVALDAVGQNLLGFGPEEVLTTGLAGARELGEAGLERIETSGDPDWRAARIAAKRPDRFYHFAYFRLPRPLFKPLAAAARVRPVFDEAACDLCGRCLDGCPARALSTARGKIRRDDRTCILCFGCVAACPRGSAAAKLDFFSEREKRRSADYLV